MIDDFYVPFHEKVDQVTEHAERASWERVLGNDPVSWRIVKVRVWRYWPLAQIGESDEEEVKFASLRWDVHLETITLEQALELFALPRDLGEWEGKQIKASIWRFWPYVQWWSLFASLKEDDPYTIEFERWCELVQEKIEKEKAALLQEFEYKNKDGIVKMWRRWPFIKWNRLNIRLPKWIDWAKISYDEIVTYIDAEAWSKKKKKTTKKKAPTKKSSKKTVKKTKKK
jgi:DNA topoisomerase-1